MQELIEAAREAADFIGEEAIGFRQNSPVFLLEQRLRSALSNAETHLPALKAAGGWRPIESAPDAFDETYFLVRPRGRHPARGTPFTPSVVTRLEDELFTADNHIDPVKWSKGGDILAGPTSDIREADLEWMPLPPAPGYLALGAVPEGGEERGTSRTDPSAANGRPDSQHSAGGEG